MARKVKVVAPPPENYVPEPLVSPQVTVEEQEVSEWSDSSLTDLIEETAPTEPSAEELEKDRIAQRRYEEIQRQKQEEADRLAKLEELKKQELEDAERLKRELAEEKDRLAAIAYAKLQEAKKVEEIIEDPVPVRKKPEKKEDAKLKAELDALRAENERLAREKEAAEKAREETIVAMRNKATEQRGNQLNMVKSRKPSLWVRLKARLKRKRIELATVGVKNYETAIIQRARIAVPKMLDDIEKMHEQLTILEELLNKHKEREKIKD